MIMRKLKIKQNNRQNVLVTVHGFLKHIEPAKNRPGCVLHVTDNHTTGKYYIPLSPHECRKEFLEGNIITFRMYADTCSDEDEIYETAGNNTRLWNAI